jgi:hypothetical protein
MYILENVGKIINRSLYFSALFITQQMLFLHAQSRLFVNLQITRKTTNSIYVHYLKGAIVNSRVKKIIIIFIYKESIQLTAAACP